MKRPEGDRRSADYTLGVIPAAKRVLSAGKSCLTVVMVSSAITAILITDTFSIRTRALNAVKGAWNGATTGEIDPGVEARPVVYSQKESHSVEGSPPRERPDVRPVDAKLNRSMDEYLSEDGRHIPGPKVGIDHQNQCVVIYSQTDIVLLEMQGEGGEVFAISNIKEGTCVIPFSDFPEGIAQGIAYGQSIDLPGRDEDLEAKHYSLVTTAETIETSKP